MDDTSHNHRSPGDTGEVMGFLIDVNKKVLPFVFGGLALFIASYLIRTHLCEDCPASPDPTFTPTRIPEPSIHTKPRVDGTMWYPRSTEVVISWSQHPATLYTIVEFRTPNNKQWIRLSSRNTDNSILHKNVIEGQNYAYRVKSVFPNDLHSAWSKPFWITFGYFDVRTPEPTRTRSPPNSP